MRRPAFTAILSVILALAFLAAAQADVPKTHLIFIGGDADYEECKNNIFRNILINNEALQDKAESFFVKSTNGDYSNATAMQRTRIAESFLSEDGRNVVAGYSHGGQSVYFLEAENISDIYLFDACVSIGGKCSEPVGSGKVWTEWILSTARKGINVHLFASIGKHNEPSGAKNAMVHLQETAAEDASLTALENGWYRVTDDGQNEIALIETVLLEGTHKDICIITEEQVMRYLFGNAD